MSTSKMDRPGFTVTPVKEDEWDAPLPKLLARAVRRATDAGTLDSEAGK